MSEMMSTFEAVLIVPIYQCVFMIWLIICGQVFLDEFGGSASWQLGVFATACFFCGLGIVILSQRRPAEKKPTSPSANGSAAPANGTAPTATATGTSAAVATTPGVAVVAASTPAAVGDAPAEAV